MKHSGIPLLLIFLVSTLAFVGTASAEPDKRTIPADTIAVCEGGTLYDTLVVGLPNQDDPNVSMDLLNGPGTLTWAVAGGKIYGYYEYTPGQDTAFLIEFQVRFSATDSNVYYHNYLVIYDESPTVLDQYNSFKVCYGGPHSVKVYAMDPEWYPLAYALLSGPGSIGATGLITYTPDTSGVYVFVVEVSDACSSDTGTVYDTVTFNRPPYIIPPDSIFALCEPGEICFDVLFADPDGDQVWFEQTGGPGSTVIANDSTAHTCFVPTGGDSTWYTFYYSFLDNCEGIVDKATLDPSWLRDSVRILVVLNRPPVLECPPPQEFFSCETDSFCFTVTASDPEGAPLQFHVLSGNAVIDANGQVCFEGSESSQFDITIEAVDNCGAADTCTVPVTVNGNRPPVVQTAPDFEATLCALDTICFPVTVDDPDLDIASVVTNFGVWDDAADQVCFTPDSAGLYAIIVTATDSCGLSDADTTLVTVVIPDPPVVDLGDDFAAALCGPFEICVNAYIIAEGITSYLLPDESVFTFEPQTGRICFTPDTAGVYLIELGVTAVCGFSDVDTALVTVTFPPAPFVQLGTGSEEHYAFCEPQEICVDVQTVAAWVSLTSNFGTYNAETGQFCFWADTAGAYELIATVVDSCEYSASDTILVTVEFGQPPVVVLPADTAVFWCTPGEICVPVTVTDPDGDVASVVSDIGTYDPQTGTVCFSPAESGTYMITVTAVDSCGFAAADDILVTVNLAGPSSVSLGNDFAVSQCAPEEICVTPSIVADQIVSYVGPNIGAFNAETGLLCFTPEAAGTFQIVFGIIDGCGREVLDTLNIAVELAPLPFVDLGDDFNADLCVPEPICVAVATIANYVSLTPSLGVYNSQTGEVCFTPEAEGLYSLIVTVVDSCGAIVADTVNIGVTFGAPPVISPLPDTTIYVCYAQWICLPLEVTDPDNDLASVTVNRGIVTDDGRVCFVPYTGGEYAIIVTAVDSCGNQDVDTALVTIITDENVNIECPGDTTVFTCSLVDTFCFEIPGIPEGAAVSVSGINTRWNAATQSVCFWSQCSNQNRIRLTVTTPCSTYSCEFTVTVLCNSDPVVFLPKDTTIGLCEPTTMCFPVGISDANHNLASIEVSGGTYVPGTGRVCVDLPYSGSVEVIVTATDSCGASDSDRMVITVTPNTPPDVTVDSPDSTLRQCVPTSICLPVVITDPDGHEVTLTFLTPGFVFDSAASLICFTPDSSGTYRGIIVVTDECGVPDTAGFYATVETGSYVVVECPIEQPLAYDLCTPGPVCIPVPVSGPDFQVSTSFGQWANGELCFTADSSGTYVIRLIGVSECNADTCDVTAIVTIGEPVSIICPPDTTVYLCGPDTLCFPFSVSGSGATVSVVGDAYLGQGTVCVPILSGSGTRTITLIGAGECGADTCSFTITFGMNRPPAIVLTTPPAVTTCTTADVCVKFTASDPDNNIVSISAPGSVVGADSICFANLAVGTYQVIATVTDACGATAKDTVLIRVLPGVSATIICPTILPVDTICAPDTICVAAPVSPAGAQVTVTPVGYYNEATGEVCVPASATGTINVRVIAAAPCGNDTCDFTINVVRAEAPTVTVPATIDTLLCLTQPQTICYPATVTGTAVTVTVTSPATYSSGQICLSVSQAGTYNIDVTANGYCGSVTRRTTVVVAADQVPVITVPAMQTFERCPGDTDVICLDGIFADDAESVPALAMVCGIGEFANAAPDSGSVCFVPDTVGIYAFCFEATDGCKIGRDTMYVEIVEKVDCDVCLRLRIESGACTPVGVNKQVQIFIESNEPVGGFDVLLSFDKSVLTFNWVVPGTALEGWEYFTYRLDDVTCGSSCPSRYLRLVGIAEMNNGAQHPPESAFWLNGLFATIEFYVANDQNLGDQFVPIKFFWFDCGDNSFSDPTGMNQYIDIRIFNNEGYYLWDEYDEVNYPESSRPLGLGANDQCVQTIPDKPSATRCIEFYNGGIWICHPDSLDDRGDVNLNGIAYEIGDAVVFSNYFIYGLSAFTINIAGQTAATDVNGDGLTLTVADLVYLIRVIVGDAEPLPRLNPFQGEIAYDLTRDGDLYRIETEAPGEIGGAYLTYVVPDGSEVLNVAPGGGADHMDLMWNVVDNQLRVLVFDIGSGSIAAGRQELVEIEVSGSGDLRPAKTEIVDYQGAPYRIAAGKGTLPSAFSLNQNYPNPFNPATTIGFALAQPSDWVLEIFNVNGGLVRTFTGRADVGNVTVTWDATDAAGGKVASGVYFYRLEAGAFTDTRKMILLK